MRNCTNLYTNSPFKFQFNTIVSHTEDGLPNYLIFECPTSYLFFSDQVVSTLYTRYCDIKLTKELGLTTPIGEITKLEFEAFKILETETHKAQDFYTELRSKKKAKVKKHGNK